MSTSQHNTDSSLNNLPERNATKLTSSGASAGSIGAINSEIDKEKSIPTDTKKNNEEEQVPIDKHGDTWGGGNTTYHHEFR